MTSPALLPLGDGNEINKSKKKKKKSSIKLDKLIITFLLLFPEDHVEKKFKNIFEGDIQLTSSDKDGVDTSNTNSADTAEVDVDSVVTKRKAISSRRHLWVRKVVPVELGPGACKPTWNKILISNFVPYFSSSRAPLRSKRREILETRIFKLCTKIFLLEPWFKRTST